MSTLVDTNVLSELLRPRPDDAVLAWFAQQPADTLFVSAVTQAEMLLGAQFLPNGKRRTALRQTLDAMFSEDFSGRVLPFDAAAAAAYAELVAARSRTGRPISQFDGQIAAVALCRRARLATCNVGNFEGCGLTLVNPWRPV